MGGAPTMATPKKKRKGETLSLFDLCPAGGSDLLFASKLSNVLGQNFSFVQKKPTPRMEPCESKDRFSRTSKVLSPEREIRGPANQYPKPTPMCPALHRPGSSLYIQ